MLPGRDAAPTRLEFERLTLAGRSKERCDIAPDIVEIDRPAHLPRDSPLLRQPGSDGDACECVDLAGPATLHFEARAVLKEADTIGLTSLILERCAQQSRPQRHAHDRHIARDRIGERERRLVRKQLCLERRIDECVSGGLLVSACGQRLQHPGFRGVIGR